MASSSVIRLSSSLGTEHSISSANSKSPLSFTKMLSPDKFKYASSQDQTSAFDDDNISPTLSPQLLATSAGLGNELVPSISNISLLSLNQQQSASLNDPPSSSSSGTNNRQRNLRSSANSIGFFQSSTSSPSNFNNRKHSMNSPNAFRRPSNYQTSSRKNSSNIEFSEPDSPSLAPISIAGSPSNFLLSQNSPPSSLKNQMGAYLMANQIPRYLRNGRRLSQNQNGLSLNNLTRSFCSVDSQSPLQTTPILKLNLQKSPQLAPVSTTLPPVTPLTLSMPSELSMRSNSQAVFDDDDDLEGVDDNEIYNVPLNRNFGSNDTTEDIFGEKIDD